ncbi:unnamed protein product, partial [Cylicostephanus goldi]
KILHKPSNEHCLILKNAEQHEEAEYACHAVNPAGEAWCYADLHVRAGVSANADGKDKHETESLEPAKEVESKHDQAESVRSKRGMKVKNIGKIFKKPFEKKEGGSAADDVGTILKKPYEKKEEGPGPKDVGKILKKPSEKKEQGPTAEDVNKKSKEDTTKKLSQKLPPRSTKKAAEEGDLPKEAQPHAEIPKQTKKIPATDYEFPALAKILPDIRGSSISLNESEMSINAANRTAAAAAAKIERKKKKRPKSLVIPLEINSLFGDRSVIRSETNLTTSMTAIEAHAEAASPLREPRSTSISARLPSPSRNRRSRTVSPREVSAEFKFERPSQSYEEETSICIREGAIQKADDEMNVESMRKKSSGKEKAGVDFDIDEDEELRQMLISPEADMGIAAKNLTSSTEKDHKEVESEIYKTAQQKKAKTKKTTTSSSDSVAVEKPADLHSSKDTDQDFRKEMSSGLTEARPPPEAVQDDKALHGKGSKARVETKKKSAEPEPDASNDKAKRDESNHRAKQPSTSEDTRKEKPEAKDKKQTEGKAKEDEGKNLRKQEQRVVHDSQPSTSTKEAAGEQQEMNVDKDAEAKSETKHLKKAGIKGKESQEVENASVLKTTDLDIRDNLKKQKRSGEDVDGEEAATSKKEDASSTLEHHVSEAESILAAGTLAHRGAKEQEVKGDKKAAKNSSKQKDKTSKEGDVMLEEKDQAQHAVESKSTKQEVEKKSEEPEKDSSTSKADEAHSDSKMISE